MEHRPSSQPARRVPLRIGLAALSLALALAGNCALSATPAGLPAVQSARAQELALACNGGAVTPSQTEGPFYKPGSPETQRAWQYWARRAGCEDLLRQLG